MREPLGVEGGREGPEQTMLCQIVASATMEQRADDEIEEDFSDKTLYRINENMVYKDQLRFEDEDIWEGVAESGRDAEEGCDEN
ncbi:hypothetical protein PIB30_102434, partial [Stylosanthes scabra]|nr:hypothetical protein [Stylosanthes scabra]